MDAVESGSCAERVVGDRGGQCRNMEQPNRRRRVVEHDDRWGAFMEYTDTGRYHMGGRQPTGPNLGQRQRHGDDMVGVDAAEPDMERNDGYGTELVYGDECGLVVGDTAPTVRGLANQLCQSDRR